MWWIVALISLLFICYVYFVMGFLLYLYYFLLSYVCGWGGFIYVV